MGHAGQSVPVVRQVCRRNTGEAGIYRLYRQLQDLYQIPEIQKADGEPERKLADIRGHAAGNH